MDLLSAVVSRKIHTDSIGSAMSKDVKAMTVTVMREKNEDGWWYVAQSGELCAQAKEMADVRYEFERMLIGSQALRGELQPRQYQIAYVFNTEVNVLSDGERVTGWADEDGIPVDDVHPPCTTDDDHDWIYSRTGKAMRECVRCGMQQTDKEQADE